MSWESLPIELVEHILTFCTGSQFAVSARVCRTWFRAYCNVERTNYDFWCNKCLQEIPRPLLEDLSPGQRCVQELDCDQCKEIYIKWFRGRHISNHDFRVIESSESFGSDFDRYHNISALALTGNVVILGHLSGRVSLLDIENQSKALRIVDHKDVVNDLALINLTNQDEFDYFSLGPKKNNSYSNHHHVISVGQDHSIFISLIGHQKKSFEIKSGRVRSFLKVKVCRDLFAVSAKEGTDISLFRLEFLESEKVLDLSPLRATHVSTIRLDEVFADAVYWLGLFTFYDLKFSVSNCHSSESLISFIDVIDDNLQNEKSFASLRTQELSFAAHDQDAHSQELHVAALTGFAFGDKIFFLLTSHGQTLFTTDGQTFRVCPLEYCLIRSDRLTSVFLFGCLLACGTHNGYVFIHLCPNLDRLSCVDDFEPKFAQQICKSPIIKIWITDNGYQPILAVATTHKVFLIKWNKEVIESSLENRFTDSPEVIDIE